MQCDMDAGCGKVERRRRSDESDECDELVLGSHQLCTELGDRLIAAYSLWEPV